jgi:hypothetical protein
MIKFAKCHHPPLYYVDWPIVTYLKAIAKENRSLKSPPFWFEGIITAAAMLTYINSHCIPRAEPAGGHHYYTYIYRQTCAAHRQFSITFSFLSFRPKYQISFIQRGIVGGRTALSAAAAAKTTTRENCDAYLMRERGSI